MPLFTRDLFPRRKPPVRLPAFVGQTLYHVSGVVLAVLLVAALFGACLAFSGCSLWGTPVAKQEQAERKLAESDAALVTEAQKEVAGVKESLAAAPSSRPVEVAKDAATRADSLLAQANGPLPAAEVAKRIAIVQGQLSEEVARRESAERALAAERADAAALSRENAGLKAEVAKAAEATKAWALERDETARKWERLWFWIYTAAGVYAASILLPIAANLFSGGSAGPVLSLASKAVGWVSAPAIQWTKDRAVGGLTRVGQALEEFRQDAPAMAAKITRHFDSATDADHQAIIGAAARDYRAALPPKTADA